MKKILRLGSLIAIVALIAGVLAACSSSDSDDNGGGGGDKLKVAFVYIGPVGDAGWTKKHDDGRKELEQELGDQVEVTYLESVPEGAKSEATFEKLARDGYGLIFGTSFGYGDAMLKVAKKYPDVKFEWATGFKTAKNLGTYFGAAEEARYLSGIAAGAASATGKIGYVAAFPIPEVLRGINAFTLGAQSVNPNATVQVVWTSTWFGPAKEKAAAESLRDAGVDVLSQHQDSPATGEVAEAAGLKWVGYNDDLERFAPQAWLTGAVWDWGPFYIATAKAVIDGTWKSDQYYGTIADGLVGLAPFGPSVTQATKDQIATKQAAIVDGSFKPFTGPIEDQDGNVIVPAGQTASLVDLLGTDYFVKGVIGEIPEG
ncbi:MAG: BMP family ABC transporter substrate-binding protein [Actinomycetes bacterium]